jgi:hypothetical protein
MCIFTALRFATKLKGNGSQVIGSGFHHNLTNDTIASVEDVIESLFY